MANLKKGKVVKRDEFENQKLKIIILYSALITFRDAYFAMTMTIIYIMAMYVLLYCRYIYSHFCTYDTLPQLGICAHPCTWVCTQLCAWISMHITLDLTWSPQIQLPLTQ